MLNILVAVFLALSAAILWAINGYILTKFIRAKGSSIYNTVRILMATIILFTLCGVYDGYSSLIEIGWDNAMLLALSGFVGIFIGDSFLFAGLKRLGPHLSALLFSLNAPISIIWEVFFRGEIYTTGMMVGCSLVLSGIAIALWRRARISKSGSLELTLDKITPFGVFCSFMGALGQAAGNLISKPVIMAGALPLPSLSIRVGVAGLFLALIFLPIRWKTLLSFDKKDYAVSFISVIMGMVLGMWFILMALKFAPVGIVSTLSSSTPLFILLLIIMLEKKRMDLWAWFASFLALLGTALIFH